MILPDAGRVAVPIDKQIHGMEGLSVLVCIPIFPTCKTVRHSCCCCDGISDEQFSDGRVYSGSRLRGPSIMAGKAWRRAQGGPLPLHPQSGSGGKWMLIPSDSSFHTFFSVESSAQEMLLPTFRLCLLLSYISLERPPTAQGVLPRWFQTPPR